MRLEEFEYALPGDCIAQQPPAERDGGRLLRLERRTGALSDHWFRELPELLRSGDLLVANDTRVFPARLHGRRDSGAEGTVEALLLQETGAGEWEALVRPGRRLGPGDRIDFGEGLRAEVVGRGEKGLRRLRFEHAGELAAELERHGRVPLPPYIKRADAVEDRERYQTIYAQRRGSAAAPTAGLHFTPAVLAALAKRGVEWATVTLHIGTGTFQPVQVEEIAAHAMHSERFEVGAEAATQVRAARAEGRRVIAVGTTAARALEAAARASGDFGPAAGETRIFFYPAGEEFRVVDGLLTNFHAPRSTLLMMVAALAGLEQVKRAYRHALAEGYRFLSYGDCMLIV